MKDERLSHASLKEIKDDRWEELNNPLDQANTLSNH